MPFVTLEIVWGGHLKPNKLVAMISNIIYMKSKNPPRLGRGYQPPRRMVDEMGTEAHY